MLKKTSFWEEEKDAPLFNLNKGFIEREGDNLYIRANRWTELVGNQKEEGDYAPRDGIFL